MIHSATLTCNNGTQQLPTQVATQQAIGCQKVVKNTLGMISETHAYLKFEMPSYLKCQIDVEKPNLFDITKGCMNDIYPVMSI